MLTAMDESRRRGPYAKSTERRATIVAAAFEVFAERGFNSGSFQDIADRVGMSQTGLLHYFPTKNALLIAVLLRRDQLTDEVPHPSLGLVPSILSRAHANAKVPGVVQLYSVLCGEATTSDHPGRDYFVGRFRGLRSDYAAELGRLRLREGVDPQTAAATIVALWDGIQLQWLLDPEAVDVEQVLTEYLRLILPAGVEWSPDEAAGPGG